jgi:hypothetical protein
MKHFKRGDDLELGNNAFAFWRKDSHGKVFIQRKRLPKNSPREVRELRDLWVEGGRVYMIKYFRKNLPEHLSIRDALDLANEILRGNWRRFGGKV